MLNEKHSAAGWNERRVAKKEQEYPFAPIDAVCASRHLMTTRQKRSKPEYAFDWPVKK